MFWSNVFVWDGTAADLTTLLDRVYLPTIKLLREDRKRQATVALTTGFLEKLTGKQGRFLLSELRDLAVLQQIDFATVEVQDMPLPELENYLMRERQGIFGVLGDDVILRGHFAFAEKNPFELVPTLHKLGYRWVLLDPLNVLGPYVDLMDDTIYELGTAGTVYAYFPNRVANKILREGSVPTSRQFLERFPTKMDRKCYTVTTLSEQDLLNAPDGLWNLLDDLYADLAIRSWRVSVLEELFQKRRRLEGEEVER
ncbi:MAG TPA: hypothetical protein ENK07_02965 [Bacteroidetes bacterium]|nr:hypothetical protein [Bacteroidota bacterium]